MFESVLVKEGIRPNKSKAKSRVSKSRHTNSKAISNRLVKRKYNIYLLDFTLLILLGDYFYVREKKIIKKKFTPKKKFIKKKFFFSQ